MFLSKIKLLNFKNHASLQIQFSKKINCLIGRNGAGKTNLLDAIYYLCLTKSYFNPVEQQNIMFKADFFRLDGEFRKQNELYQLVYKLPSGKKKELLVNETPVPRLSQHVGNFPVIIISPDDSLLITGSSEERRRFMDTTISQINSQYLEYLMLYQKLLTQRNAALKRFAETGKTDKALIESYNAQMVLPAEKIYEARKISMQKMLPLFQEYYQKLSSGHETVGFTYISQLNETPFSELLQQNYQRDLILQRTEAGIQKDDLEFYFSPAKKMGIGAEDVAVKVKRFASQGQQKSFIIAIKFAQYSFIRAAKDFHPLMLIDDIFDKLDNYRSQKLVELIAGDEFGQVFLSDTDDAHMREVLSGREGLYDIINI